MRKVYLHFVVVAMTMLFMASSGLAQLGSGWVQYTVNKKIHFELNGGSDYLNLDWTAHASFRNPPIASYDYDAATEKEIFRLYGDAANRAEIRLYNDYATGSRQFEGYVTFYSPLENEGLFQIWGSTSGATQMMIRGYSENNGSIGINHAGGTPKFLSNCYGREIKVNVIHLQENVGNKIIVYFDNVKTLEFPDNEKPTNYNGNYWKYGCYGTVPSGHESPKVQWRAVKIFKDGVATNKQSQTITFPALPSKTVGDADFAPGATASSGLTVSYTSSNTTVAEIVNGKIHIKAAGTSTITASQAGNTTYNPAPSETRTLTVTTGTPTPTWYKIKVVNNPTYVLNCAGTPANGVNVNVYTYNGSNAQLWQLIDVGSGYVKIVPRSNPAYGLDCSATPANGVNLQVWSYSGNTRQQWLKTDMGGGNNKITVRANAAFGLDCSATPANNVNVQMWSYSGNNRQQWILEPILKSAEMQPETSSVLSLTCTPFYITESAIVSYAVAEDALTSVVVYNMFGQKVKDLGSKYQQAGQYSVTIDAANLKNGMYIIRLVSGTSESNCRIIVKK